jgi:hypothetical protein
MANTRERNYQNGKIYSIRSYQTNKVYYGSTIQLLCKRLSKHVNDFNAYQRGNFNNITSFEILKYEDAYIELVENFPCNSKVELEKREGEIIRENENAVNRIIVGRTREEYRKDNKDHINQNNKQYRKINKAILNINQNKKNSCFLCGGKYTQANKSQHLKTTKHQQYLKQVKQLEEILEMHNKMIDRHKHMYPINY